MIRHSLWFDSLSVFSHIYNKVIKQQEQVLQCMQSSPLYFYTTFLFFFKDFFIEIVMNKKARDFKTNEAMKCVPCAKVF